MPHNYSPVNFDNPDYDRYPMFKQAKVYKVHLQAGDCLFLPGLWWHQVASSPNECIAVSTWYHSNSKLEAVITEGIPYYD
jgi:hypoxia-inducible factor 1-alpha inhibitor (HIF hydroxylase)